MSLQTKYIVGALALTASLPTFSKAGAFCNWVTQDDGTLKCIPVEDPRLIIVDPSWLVAGGVAFLLLVAATIFLAFKVSRLADRLKGTGRIG